MPPSLHVLIQRARRTNLVTRLWTNANLQDPLFDVDPLTSEWNLDSGDNTLLWYNGPQMPQDVAMNMYRIQKDDEEFELCNYESDDDSEGSSDDQ